jgi:DNA primase large subunit
MASDWWARKTSEEKYEMMGEQLERLRRMGWKLSREDLEKFKTMEPRARKNIFIPERSFPPCIKNISKGLADGRTRSLFTLINFLRSANWDWEQAEKYIYEWNEKNTPPLRENYVRSQIRWHKARGKSILPPNCDHEGWYKDFGACKPDGICKAIKNPVNYGMRGQRKEKPPKEPKKPRKTKK